MLPSLFIAHGSPMLALEDNEYTQFIRTLDTSLPRPKAIVLFSAHWLAPVQKVSYVEKYQTIYDFGGFPDALYQIRYPAQGDQRIASKISDLLGSHGISHQLDQERGLDHGAWVVLRMLYPEADIPVVAMSVNPRLTPEQQYEIGAALASLRAEDVLIIGSGGTVHNLRAVDFRDNGEVVDWAQSFDGWLEQHLLKWDLASLYEYADLAPGASFAVPKYGNEHFVPLFYAMGAASDVKQAKLLHRSYRYGTLSHSVWQFG